MTSTITTLRPRSSNHGELPHLPAIARDPIDDAREVLAAFSRKQDGEMDIPYADLAEDLAAALRTALGLLSRPPAKPVLRPWTRLRIEQARQFVMELDPATAGVNPLKAMF